MERKTKIDDLFKSELGSYTETPPPAVWEALEDRLDAVPKPRGPLTWLTYLAIICVFITATIWMATGLTGSKDQLAQQAPGTESNTANHSTPAGNTAPITEHTGSTPANNDATTTNSTGNENNTPTNTPTTGPNRVSNTKPAVYNSTGAPVTAKVVNTSVNNAGKPDNQAKNDGTANETTTGHKTNPTKKDHGHNRSTGNNKNKRGDKSSKNNYGTYAVADDEPTLVKNQDNYNSGTPGQSNTNTSNTKPDETAAPDKSNTTNENTKQDETTQPQTQKDNPQMLAPNDAPKPKKQKAKFDRFEAGVKAGYEQGFDNDAAQKGVFAPFLQYRLSKKVGIMLQPAVKYANVTSRQIGDARTYYRADEGAITNITRDNITLGTDSTGNPTYAYQYNYQYSQTHDSIVKSNWTGGKYLEFEIPVLAKYYVADNFSFYAGVNMIYSKLTGLTEHTYAENGIKRGVNMQSNIVYAPIDPSQLSRPDFKYTGNPYSQYSGPQYPAPTASTFRIGYMAGFSWEFEDRWLIDALVQQTFIKPNVQAGFNTYTPLAAPYIRLTLGYKIIK